MRNIGGLEIALIVLAVVLIFGVGKLGQVGGASGQEHQGVPSREGQEGRRFGSGLGQTPRARRLRPKSTKEKFCPGCGNKLAANAKFCMECGAKMGDFRLGAWLQRSEGLLVFSSSTSSQSGKTQGPRYSLRVARGQGSEGRWTFSA